jgi:hypothetical protein
LTWSHLPFAQQLIVFAGFSGEPGAAGAVPVPGLVCAITKGTEIANAATVSKLTNLFISSLLKIIFHFEQPFRAALPLFPVG